MRNNIWRTVSGFGAACSIAFAAAPAGSETQFTSGPAIWKISDADTTIFVLGTIHILPKDAQWRSPAVTAAMADTAELVLESTSADEGGATAWMMEVMTQTKERKPVLERVSPEKRPLLQSAINDSGMPIAMFNKLPTWMVPFMITYADAEKRGEVGEFGVDNKLEQHFIESKRPVSAIEDGVAVLKAMDGLTEEDQIIALERSLDEREKEKTDGNKMVAQWLSGDLSTLETEVNEETLGVATYAILVRNRNTAWSEWLTKRLETPGNILFAAGTAHFVGSDSVLKMLAAKGITATRL